MKGVETFSNVEKTKSGKIKIKKITKRRVYLYCVWSILCIITLCTLFTINFNEINFKVALMDLGKNLKWMFLEAKLSERYTILQILKSLVVTISIAILTTIIGATVALFLSFFASKNLSSERVSKIIKIVMSFIRAVPTILWVMIFSVVASIGIEAAVIGMTFHSVSYLTKAYSESIEEIDNGIIESLRATGASWWQIIFQGVIPTCFNSILSWTFVRFEINFTNAVVVGAASGAGGLGYEMFMAGTMYFDIKEIGFFTYLVFFVTILLETISIKLREKYIMK